MEAVEYHIGFSYFNYWIYLYALSHHQLWKTHDSVLPGKGISFIPLSSLMSITCIQVLTRDTLQCLKIPASSHLWADFDYWIFFFQSLCQNCFFSFSVWILLNWCPGFVWSYYCLCNIYFLSPVYCLFLTQFSFSWSFDPSYRKREGEPGF